MHVVVIDGWQEVSGELAGALASALGATAYEARQRLIGGPPAVAACCAGPEPAREVAVKLQEGGFQGFVVDAAKLDSGGEPVVARRFLPGERGMAVEAGNGQGGEVAYADIELLLRVSRITAQTTVMTTSERRLSVGRAALTGGLAVTKKVKGEEEVTSEEREEVLYLFAAGRSPLAFAENGLNYGGLGAQMQPSRERNFLCLVNELRRRAASARYDERLLRRAAQAHLLGPLLSPERHLPLAVAILARSLKRSR